MSLVTVQNTKDRLKISDLDLRVDCLEVYKTAEAGVTSATVEITTTGLVLVDNINGTTTYILATYATVTALVTAVNAGSANWSVVAVGVPGNDPTDFVRTAATACLLEDNLAVLQVVNNWIIDQLCDGVSAQAEKICGMVFSATDRRVFMDGNNDTELLLDHFPIISVYYVATSTANGIMVRNSSTTASTAFVVVSSIGITLTVKIGATETVSALLFSAHTTLSTMVAAINALGNGWEAVVAASIDHASADLIPSPGKYVLNTWVTSYVPSNFLSDYAVYSDRGILFLSTGWASGIDNVIVKYRSGYETIPAELASIIYSEIVIQYADIRRNLSLKSETLGDYRWVADAITPSDRFERALSMFMNRRLDR